MIFFGGGASFSYSGTVWEGYGAFRRSKHAGEGTSLGAGIGIFMSSSHFQFALCLAFVVQDINRQLPAPANSCHASSPLWALSPRNCKTKYIHSSISHFLSRCFITAAKSNSCGCLSPDSQTWLLKLYGSWTHLPIFVLLLYSLTSRSAFLTFVPLPFFYLCFHCLKFPLSFIPS